MVKHLIACFGLIWGASAHAQSQTSCSMTNDQENCNRVVACVGSEGLWFNGRAFGRGEGTFAGTLSDGTLCSGTWMSRNLLGLGQADVSCEGGREGRLFYTYQDSYTGPAIGQGLMNTGEAVKIWSGNNVLAYLRGDTGERIAILPCGDGVLLIS